MASQAFPESYFHRHDESDDALFYRGRPREEYLDEAAVGALKSFFRQHLPPHGVYLDLLTSWHSYIPVDLQPMSVIGLGLDPVAMADNPRLDEFHVVDLNRRPILPFDDERFDAVLCTVSIQYLTQPLSVFKQVFRVLRPGGRFVISFSSGFYPEKAIAVWLITTAEQRLALVRRYFQLSADWVDVHSCDRPEIRQQDPGTEPLHLVWARKPRSDAIN